MSRREEVDVTLGHLIRLEAADMACDLARTLADEVDTLRAEKSRIASDFFEASAQRASRDAVITKLLAMLEPTGLIRMPGKPTAIAPETTVAIQAHRTLLHARACEIAGRKK